MKRYPIRKFLALTAILFAVLVAGIPTLNGWWLRQQIAAAVDRLPESPDFRLEHTGSRAGWIESGLSLRLHGAAVNAPEEGIPLEISVYHGPLIWQLFDSPWALAQLQLHTPADYSGPGANRYSGAAVMRISPGARLVARGILGGAAFGGDHQVQFTGSWPLLAESNNAAILGASVNVYLELDAEALQASPAANALRLYERQGWTRISHGRALTDLQLEDGVLTINGRRLSLRGLLAQR